MKKARKKRIVRRKRRISEREIMRIKRKLKKSARKLRLGAKRTGAYVYGTLRRIVGNPLEKMGVYAGRDGFEITDFKRGDRIQLHPGMDLWMRGAKYGQIIGIGRKKLLVKLDYLRRPIAISPRSIGEIMYREMSANRRIRRNEEYARQIPRESRSMRARGFSKGFDFSAGSNYQDLLKFVSGGRGGGFSRKIGANTYVNRYGDGSIGVILYQTRILHYHPNGDVDVNFGGYMTPTTFSRINALIPYGWRLRKKDGKLALENSWGQRAVIRKPRAGEEYAVRLTEDRAYLIT